MKLSLRIALVCGALPLCTGLLVFLLWLLTRWPGWMTAGSYTLGGGVILCGIGCVALAVYVWQALHGPVCERTRVWRTAAKAALLLLVNFPVAAGIMYAAGSVVACYRIDIRNNSGKPMESVRVTGGGYDLQLGTLRPGESVRRRLWFKQDGSLAVKAVSGGEAKEVMAEGYVTGGFGGTSSVTLSESGEWEISRTSR